MDLGTFYREFQNPPQLASLSLHISSQSMADDLVTRYLIVFKSRGTWMHVRNNQDLYFLSAGLTARETGRLWEKHWRVWRFCGHAPIEDERRKRLTWEDDCTWEKTKWVMVNEREKLPGGSVVVCYVRIRLNHHVFNVKLLISDIVLSPLPAQHVHLAYQVVQIVFSTVNTVLAPLTLAPTPLWSDNLFKLKIFVFYVAQICSCPWCFVTKSD